MAIALVTNRPGLVGGRDICRHGPRGARPFLFLDVSGKLFRDFLGSIIRLLCHKSMPG